jgi:soluble lytic murein transglycosylase-like protein
MSCLAESARRFGVPVRALGLIMAVEAGRVGEIVKNRGGSYDMGPMQINSFWLPLLGAMGVGEREVVGDGCVNVAVGAWILRSHLGRTGSLAQAVADYHSLNPVLGKRYLRAARARLRGLDLGQTLMRANSGLARGAGR